MVSVARALTGGHALLHFVGVVESGRSLAVSCNLACIAPSIAHLPRVASIFADLPHVTPRFAHLAPVSLVILTEIAPSIVEVAPPLNILTRVPHVNCMAEVFEVQQVGKVQIFLG